MNCGLFTDQVMDHYMSPRNVGALRDAIAAYERK